MPRFDQTGPSGQGPMTGRKMGDCSTSNLNNTTQFAENERSEARNFMGRGFGARREFGFRSNRCGRGFGMGRPGFGRR